METVDSDPEVLKETTQVVLNEIQEWTLVIDELEHQLSELEKKERDRAQLLTGTASTLDVQTIHQIIKTVEFDQSMVVKVLNRMATSNANDPPRDDGRGYQ